VQAFIDEFSAAESARVPASTDGFRGVRAKLRRR